MAAEARAASADEKERVFAPIVMAFSADPFVRYAFPDPARYLTAFPLMLAVIGAPAFESETAHCLESYAGGALWLPPGVEPDGAAISSILKGNIDADRLAAVVAVLEEKAKYHPDEPHWYLHMIGIDPARQGQGTGSVLMRFALERIDDGHVAAYLESSNAANLSFYQRHGFEVLTTVQVDDAPPMFPMLRPAR